MRLSIRGRQVATVTALVACSMCALAAVHVNSLVRLGIAESGARGELLARAIFQRARLVVPAADDPQMALRDDPGIRAILESSIAYTQNVTYATIVDPSGVAIAHSSPSLEGQRQPAAPSLNALLEERALGQLRGVYRDATLEITEPLLLGETPFGSIRIGVSTVLIRSELQEALWPAAFALALTLVVALAVSLIMAQWALRPIHVIKAGLNQLSRGEPDIQLQLPPGKDFSDLGESFDAISARLSARDPAEDDGAPLESVIEQLDKMESSQQLASWGRMLAGVAHEVKNPLNAMTIHLELLKQKLTVLAPPPPAPPRITGSVLGIGAAGAYDEAGAARPVAAAVVEDDTREGAARPLLQHVAVIGNEVRRLDEVIQGFLRFVRPDELQREVVILTDLIDEVFALVRPEANRSGVKLESRGQGAAGTVTGDRAMLRQALLNLALNACQAMPSGGVLRVDIGETGRRVLVDIADSGTGMSPEALERIFELYYTTKPGGSGIGLSMVYRIVQLHGGDLEVESTVGQGTRFRIALPRLAQPRGAIELEAP